MKAHAPAHCDCDTCGVTLAWKKTVGITWRRKPRPFNWLSSPDRESGLSNLRRGGLQGITAWHTFVATCTWNGCAQTKGSPDTSRFHQRDLQLTTGNYFVHTTLYPTQYRNALLITADATKTRTRRTPTWARRSRRPLLTKYEGGGACYGVRTKGKGTGNGRAE